MADNQETTSEESQALNILITGADNGVGYVLAREAVKKGHHVFGAVTTGTVGAKRLRRIGAIPVYPELTREGALRSAIMFAKADIVVNCAPQDVMGLPQEGIDYAGKASALAEGAEALVSAAGKAGVKRLIHLSPAYVYGSPASPVNEEAPLEHGNALVNHAIEAEEAILDGGLAGYVVRAGYIYGGWHPSMMKVSESLRSGKGIASGSGNVSWIHEDDLAGALLKLVELDSDKTTAHVFNVSDGEPMTHSAFMSLFGKLYGVGEPSGINPLVFPLRTNAIQLELLNNDCVMDSSKAQDTLGWSVKTPSKQAGIEKSMVVWRALEAGDPDDKPQQSDSKALVKA